MRDGAVLARLGLHMTEGIKSHGRCEYSTDLTYVYNLMLCTAFVGITLAQMLLRPIFFPWLLEKLFI